MSSGKWMSLKTNKPVSGYVVILCWNDECGKKVVGFGYYSHIENGRLLFRVGYDCKLMTEDRIVGWMNFPTP